MGLLLFKLFMIYSILINIVSFAVMGIDKKKAEKQKWRVRERTLFLLAILGGSLGSVLGMQVFRHKTKHLNFVIGMPAILVLELIIVLKVVIF